MNETKIYTLKDKQLESYEIFRRIGYDNADFMFARIVDFIRLQHKNSGLPVAVVGASGGIDSSFVLAAAVKALGVDNVEMVMLPYDRIESSYQDSVWYARLLGNYLGIPESNKIIVPILRAVDAWEKSIMESGLHEPNTKQLGNAMARERMKILYYVADEYRGLVLDTCNNTEIKMGYLTKHGDGASDYNPVGDLYKVWIWEIARKLKLTPGEIIEREPSADLVEGQTDVDDLGITYQALDLLLWLYFNNGVTVPVLTSDYFYPVEIVNMVLKRVEANQHKSNPVPMCRIMDAGTFCQKNIILV
jgi:NAD+ synthetase